MALPLQLTLFQVVPRPGPVFFLKENCNGDEEIKFDKTCLIFIFENLECNWLRHGLVCIRRHRLIYFNKLWYFSTRHLKVRPVREIATNQLLLKFLSKWGFDQLDKSLQRRLTVSRFSIFSRRVSIWLYTGMLNVTSFAFQRQN